MRDWVRFLKRKLTIMILGNGSHHLNDDDHHSTKHRSSTNPATPQPNGQTSARSRLMFDPLSELPILERWFEENPHPSYFLIEQYTDSLNSLQYRQNYPPISTHNVKIW
jgi:hypothetical protein